MSESSPMEGAALTPDEASAALGNPTRVAVLRALWTSSEDVVSFSELRHRAGDPDSGQFNYHLGELVGTVVERTDDGYRPLQTGMQVLRTAFLGPPDDPATFDAFALEGACHHCGGGLESSYDGRDALVQCAACGKIQLHEAIPPAAVEDRSSRQAVDAFDRWVAARSMLMVDGVCPDCAGKSETALFRTRRGKNGSLDYLRVRHECGNCGYECDVPVWLHVLLARHSAVVSFFYDRGVDLACEPIWELTRYASDARVTIESDAPLRIRVELPYDGDTLGLWLDEGLDVLSATPLEGAERVADG